MSALPPPNLRGVWAKWQRAVEQLQALSEEIAVFGVQPHAWTIVTQVDADREHYVFRLQPAWPPQTAWRWGAIIGEIVHGDRSALEQLVWQLVRLNGATPSSDHTFPVRTSEPEGGFADSTRKSWRDQRGRDRHGPLFGISDQALAIIEACQPYHGGDALLLRDLHRYWNTDKHQTLVPTALWFRSATLKLTNSILQARDDRFEGDTYVIEASVLPGTPPPQPSVDVEPHTPSDIAFRDVGRPTVPVVEHLRDISKFVLMRILIPASELFPDLQGVGF